MTRWRRATDSCIYRNAARQGGVCNFWNPQLGAARQRATNTPSFAHLGLPDKRGVPMTYRHTHDRAVDARGRAIRHVLMVIVRRCAAGGLLLPQYAVLGRSLGLDRSQVSRHLKRLRAEGAYVELPGGQWRRRVSLYRNQHLRRAA